MSFILTRRTTLPDEQVYCAHDLTEMNGRMFGKARWRNWKDLELTDIVVTFSDEARAAARLFQLQLKDPDWEYSICEYDR